MRRNKKKLDKMVIEGNESEKVNNRKSSKALLRSAIRKALISSSSVCVAAISTSPAIAQQETLEEVVVTGTRVTRDGYESPTPTTVTTNEDLQLSDPGTVSDALNKLPQFQGSSKPQDGGVSANGAAGSNFLSLRNLGSERSLVLLDGRRFVAASDSNSTDINLLPQNLISRTEVVTGGASAAYGSNAVAGVVNFILDRSYEGWKGSVQGGTSTYGDSDEIKADIAHGRSFADGRGHLLFSAEYYDREGIGPYDDNRDWNRKGSGRLNNPTDEGPGVLLFREGMAVSAATFGGLVTSGPLEGTQFGEGGEPQPFEFGDLRTPTFMIGGDGIRNDRNLSGGLERMGFFGRASYDIADDHTVAAELTYSEADTMWDQYTNYCYTSCSATVFSDNAFLSDQTQQEMEESGIDSFRLGRIHNERFIKADNQKDVWRIALSAEGVLSDGWTYDAYMTHGESDTYIANLDVMHRRHYYAAMDAVEDPETGEIVCRSTLEGHDPGCVPFNAFGENSPSEEALDYVLGDEWRNLVLEQSVAAATVQGELFSIDSRPAGFAAGVEWREESSDQTVSDSALEVVDFTGIRGGVPAFEGSPGPFIVGNPQPLGGSFNVGEVFAELALPLIYDRPLISALEADVAARYTDYSLSGGVNSWKVSANYEPVPDIRFRATRSRDIRAPNVAELFTGARQGIGTARDPETGETVDVVTQSRGNTELEPETADTITAGIVYQPEMLDGFSISADYYSIGIEGAVSTLGRQESLDQCHEGNEAACNNIEFVDGTYRIDLPYMNLDELEVEGYDLEASYTAPLDRGDIRVRLLANYQKKFERTTPSGDPVDLAGEVGQSSNPKLNAKLSVNYTLDRWSIFAQQRYVDSGTYNKRLEEGEDINNNSVSSVSYTDITGTYRFGSGEEHEAYLSVNNLFDREPPFAPQVSGTHLSWSNYDLYDTIGRYFNLGVRYSF